MIAGAGAIGVEFAYVLHNYGVKVTIVEFLDRMVPLEDAEVSKELARQYRKLGIEVLTSTRVESIDDSGPSGARHGDRQGRRQQVLEADKVLQAIGFQPRVEGYGLDKTGVALTERGAIADRRPRPHQRPAHLRDRRRHREADARARGRVDGRGGGRDHRGRGDDGDSTS